MSRSPYIYALGVKTSAMPPARGMYRAQKGYAWSKRGPRGLSRSKERPAGVRTQPHTPSGSRLLWEHSAVYAVDDIGGEDGRGSMRRR